MSTPEFAHEGITFDLGAVAEPLRHEASYHRVGHAARTLVRAPDLRVVLIVLQRGARISEHHANATVSVQTMAGHVRLQLPGRSVDLPAGHLLVLGRGLPHDVEAAADSTVLLTLGWHGES